MHSYYVATFSQILDPPPPHFIIKNRHLVTTPLNIMSTSCEPPMILDYKKWFKIIKYSFLWPWLTDIWSESQIFLKQIPDET